MPHEDTQSLAHKRKAAPLENPLEETMIDPRHHPNRKSHQRNQISTDPKMAHNSLKEVKMLTDVQKFQLYLALITQGPKWIEIIIRLVQMCAS